MPDVYSTTKGAMQSMVCSDCKGHFAGTDANIIDNVTLCDNCIEQRRG